LIDVVAVFKLPSVLSGLQPTIEPTGFQPVGGSVPSSTVLPQLIVLQKFRIGDDRDRTGNLLVANQAVQSDAKAFTGTG
jgi:hypothetical protein